jgi:hypothetical protein
MRIKHREAIYLGGLLAFGLGTSGYFVSQTLYNSKVAINTAEVRGLAELTVKANKATWQLIYKVSSNSKEELPSLYASAENSQNMIIRLLTEKGFELDELEIGVVDYRNQEFRDKSQKLIEQKHTLEGSITVYTEQVELVSAVRANVNALIAQGLNIENRMPVYRFTKLNDIKPEMLRQATRNAQLAANEFAQIAGVEVGGIRNARQGNFSILDAGENYTNTNSIEKDVRVVSTITFYLSAG